MYATFLLYLLGCPGGKDDSGNDNPTDGVLRLENANNYSYVNSIDISVEEAQELYDVNLDWSGLTTDILHHSVDPSGDVDWLYLIYFPLLAEADLEEDLVSGTIQQTDTEVIATFDNSAGATSALLSDFKIFGTNAFVAEEYFQSGGYWLVRLTTGLNETRMVKLLSAAPTGAQEILIGDDGAALDFTADLHSISASTVSAGAVTSIDWSAVTTAGDGTSFNYTAADRALLAYYGSMTVEDLESQFFDIELIADGQWEATLADGTSVDLSTMTSVSDGSAFSGLDQAGTWLFALQNTIGTNPAPLVMAVIYVE